MTELFSTLISQYGYFILFIWSILEGETGLFFAGILCHTGHMYYPIAILVAAFGGFSGDQFYFFIGKHNRSSILKKFEKQKRKFALTQLLLKRYGWIILFMQRYMYGFRTIIPIVAGISGYSTKKFAMLNLFSAFIWASIIIIPVYLLGDKILTLFEHAKKHWYYAIPLFIILMGMVIYFFQKVEKRVLAKEQSSKVDLV